MDDSELTEVLSNLDPSSASQGASPSSFEEVTDGSAAAQEGAALLPGALSAHNQVATQVSTTHQGGPDGINDTNRSDQPALLSQPLFRGFLLRDLVVCFAR